MYQHMLTMSADPALKVHLPQVTHGAVMRVNAQLPANLAIVPPGAADAAALRAAPRAAANMLLLTF